MKVKTKPEHEVAFQDCCALLARHAGKLSSLEMLAIAANMLGKIVALQDQRVTTREEAMQVVIKNLELGNQQVIGELAKASGTKQ